MGSAGLETTAVSPLVWEAWGWIQNRVFAGDQLSSVERTGIQMVILIFHLANWSPHLLSGTTVICS